MFHSLMMEAQLHYYYRKERFIKNDFVHFQWIVFVVEKGKFAYEINKESGEATEGDMIICPPHVMFHREVITPVQIHIVYFEWRTRNDSMKSQPNSSVRDIPPYRLSVPRDDRFYSTMNYLRKLCNSQLPVDLSIIEHFINDLWITARIKQNNDKLSAPHAKDLLMEQAKSAMEELAFQEVSLGELAIRFHLSHSQFTRRFNDAFGINPMAYLTYIRMNKAKSYLEKTEYTMDYIAELCGYENRNYFCKVFSNHFKMPPSHYRRLYRSY
jgi:AraC-like DNA-binding protein